MDLILGQYVYPQMITVAVMGYLLIDLDIEL